MVYLPPVTIKNNHSWIGKYTNLMDRCVMGNHFISWYSLPTKNGDGKGRRMNEASFLALRILGPSNGGVGTCIAGVRVLKIDTFEGSGYLGWGILAYFQEVFAGSLDDCFCWNIQWTPQHSNYPVRRCLGTKKPASRRILEHKGIPQKTLI